MSVWSLLFGIILGPRAGRRRPTACESTNTTQIVDGLDFLTLLLGLTLGRKVEKSRIAPRTYHFSQEEVKATDEACFWSSTPAIPGVDKTKNSLYVPRVSGPPCDLPLQLLQYHAPL